MKNQEIAKMLYEMATYLHMEDVPFKPQAYERAAAAVESLSQSVEELYKTEGLKGLEKIPGVGKGIAERIEEYLKTGKVADYEAYRKKYPVNLDELGSVEGLGPKSIKELYEKLKVRDLKDLEQAGKGGKIRKLPHFGEKSEQNILQSIAFVQRSKGRWLLGTMYPYVEELIATLKDSGLVKEAVAAGSIRRMKETIGDVDILVTTKNPEKAIEYFLSHVKYNKLWGRGPTKVSVHTPQGFDIDVRVLPEEIFGAGLQYFTGSKEHNVKLRTLAIQKGYKLSEYGLFQGKKRIACTTEEEVYEALGLPYIEPEMREDQGEIEAALEHRLPRLIPYGSLRGDLQIQTNWTDGNNSIEEMAREAKKQGLEYIAITDHTAALGMTGGSDEKKLLRQMAEIDKVQKQVSGIKILKSAEVNIMKDGSLDISDEALAKLDVVGASVHSYFKLSEADQTDRLIRAMENPNVDIIFHLTGRIILQREPIALNFERILKTAKRTGTILEINASPSRLDMRDEHVRKAKEAKVHMVIDSDAHGTEHLRFLNFGIAQARRGWAEKKDVVNTLPLDKFLRSLKNRKNYA